MEIKVKNIVKIKKPEKVRQEYQRETLLEKVDDYVRCVESNEDSWYEWNYLKCLYNKLSKLKRPSDTAERILEMIEPLMMRFGPLDHENGPELDAENMFKYDREDD